MTEEAIAALDLDWAQFTPAEQAAYAYARKLTYEPHRLTDADFTALRKHYTDLQILEMTLSLAGNNSINRWKEGVGSPQSREGRGFLRKKGEPDKNTPAKEVPAVLKSFLTPTPIKYRDVATKVAPLNGKPDAGGKTVPTVSVRPPLEPRAQVEKTLQTCRTRRPRLPLIDEAEARKIVAADWPAGPLPTWARLLANFPVEGKSRAAAYHAAETKGDLSRLLKARIDWIIARQDRAWYALGLARQRLRDLGQSDDEIFRLDGNGMDFPPADRALFVVARHLAASPIVLTDADVARAVKLAGPRAVVQTISYTTHCASFNRLTEAAALPLER